jgi:CRP-like cAMP-binding protein
MSALIDRLRQLPLLDTLTDADLDQLADQVRSDRFEHDAVVFYQGDPADRVWIVQSGRVKIIYQDPGGREVILEIISPGEAFGGAAIFLPRHPATAKAMEPTETLSFPAAHFSQWLLSHPQISVKLNHLLGARLQSLMGVQIMAGERVERRMAHILIKLADRTGRPAPNGVLIPLSLSRQDLADMAGTSLETAIRTISRFRAEGLVETRAGGFLLIKDLARLRSQAG